MCFHVHSIYTVSYLKQLTCTSTSKKRCLHKYDRVHPLPKRRNPVSYPEDPDDTGSIGRGFNSLSVVAEGLREGRDFGRDSLIGDRTEGMS